METSDLYRMIEALLEAGGQTGSPAASAALQGIEGLVRALAHPRSGGGYRVERRPSPAEGGIGETIASTLLGGFPLFSLFKGLLTWAMEEETVPPLHEVSVAGGRQRERRLQRKLRVRAA